MYPHVAILALFIVAWGDSKLKIDNRIVGGNNVDISEVPYHAALAHYCQGRPFCGAAIISENYCITSGYCAFFHPLEDVVVIVGSNCLDGDHLRRIKNAIAHPKYRRGSNDYDVAVLHVQEPFIFTQTVKPIALPTVDQTIDVGTLATITGFGEIRDRGTRPHNLRAAKVPIYDWNACKNLFADQWSSSIPRYCVTESMLCAGYLSREIDACNGDSGGPMVADGVLAGIIPGGVGCARKNRLGIYAKISFHSIRNFIQETTSV